MDREDGWTNRQPDGHDDGLSGNSWATMPQIVSQALATGGSTVTNPGMVRRLGSPADGKLSRVEGENLEATRRDEKVVLDPEAAHTR